MVSYKETIYFCWQIHCSQLLRMLQISFQPFRCLFCKIPNLINADSFQFSRPLLQSCNLSGDGDIRKVCIDGFYNLPVRLLKVSFQTGYFLRRKFKLYRWMRGSVAVGRPVLFFAVVIVLVVKVA